LPSPEPAQWPVKKTWSPRSCFVKETGLRRSPVRCQIIALHENCGFQRMDASLQLQKPRKSTIEALAERTNLVAFPAALSVEDQDGICCPRTSNLNLCWHANGTCHRAVISQRCWICARAF
jgi:hypothetical protein